MAEPKLNVIFVEGAPGSGMSLFIYYFVLFVKLTYLTKENNQ
jgi:hypothetical protein